VQRVYDAAGCTWLPCEDAAEADAKTIKELQEELEFQVCLFPAVYFATPGAFVVLFAFATVCAESTCQKIPERGVVLNIVNCAHMHALLQIEKIMRDNTKLDIDKARLYEKIHVIQREHEELLERSQRWHQELIDLSPAPEAPQAPPAKRAKPFLFLMHIKDVT